MKMLKNIILFSYNLIVSLIALPFAVILILMGKLAIYASSYSEVSLIASKIPFLLGQKIRFYYYKATLNHLGEKVVFMYGSFCQYPNASIGDRVHIGYYNAIGDVIIGNDVIVGGFVNFISGTNQHSYEDPTQKISIQKAAGRSTINIGSDVWIGSNAVIAASIGDRCVIGAGSVLVKSAEEHSIYAGNPAKLIKKI
ncbi:acyltransferase [Pedobacter sp.]|uniref:acyltransferase n=1 Tax=Pedobacter sp. TaxID=1411316 RepID=UPI0031E19672